MKAIKRFLFVFILVLFGLLSPQKISADNGRIAVYFKETTCLVCAELQGYPNGPNNVYYEDQDYIKKMEDQGITVVVYDLMVDDPIDEYAYYDQDNTLVEVTALDVFSAFNETYNRDNLYVPVVFVGDTYYEGLSDIQNAVDSGDIYDASNQPLRDVSVEEGSAYAKITGFVGFLTVLFAGLLDGFNPCAIALLLLFVSLLGFSENKKFLILVSVVYIFALFISYLLIGTLLLTVLSRFQAQAALIATIINWFVAILCIILFALNLYDFFRARNKDYGNIKNQLPKFIQRFNKKIVTSFTNVLNNRDKKGVIGILAITFLLGITLSITELLCTGQIYFAILYGIHSVNSVYGYVALIAYNIMFVVPLIVIAIISIKGRGIMETSNFVREHLDLIKLLNAVLFLGIAIYYFTRIF
ncbi:MAG: hypothetical protein K9L26_05215 [Candidatus Izimaplasma sp.]|nr:hypothetical protein [Candidatus Izimaplasma bacterium]